MREKLRKWLISLIREAVRAEVEHHFRSLEDKTSLIESHFASIAIRVKEKQEERKAEKTENPRAPLRGGWIAIKNKLESE